MKGVMFNIRKESDIDVMWDGMRGRGFGPVLSIPGEDNSRTEWTHQMVGTFADLACIEAGDKVFFFKDKTIYGVGEVIDSDNGVSSPLRLNFPDALDPQPIGDSQSMDEPNGTGRIAKQDDALYTGESWTNVRVVVPFRESPAFLTGGLDMDFLLTTERIRRFPYLEFFVEKNFSLLSEAETEEMLRLLRMVNRNPTEDEIVEMSSTLEEFEQQLDRSNLDGFDLHEHVNQNRGKLLDDGRFSKENWVHGLTIEALRDGDNGSLPRQLTGRNRRQVFREFPTSPAKPTTWANHLDILTEVGPTPVADYDTEEVTTGYEVIEIKKEEIRYVDDLVDHLSQLMKYVDYVAENYADGDYEAIDAYLLTGGYSDEEGRYRDRVLQTFENRPTSSTESERIESRIPPTFREYVTPNSPSTPGVRTWNNVNLLEYEWHDSYGFKLGDPTI